VVCDAGGGTVVSVLASKRDVVQANGGGQDLISYSIESVKPFTVKECVKGDGTFLFLTLC
jgi:hypothetical protein